ncbi:MAG: hypothetical protein R2749_30590 [Acidimicrobiales bacterium]
MATTRAPTDTTATGAEAATAVPDAEQVAAMLLTAEDLGAGWTVNVGPADGPDLSNGVIRRRPVISYPARSSAEAADPAPAAAVEAIDWLAFRQLDLAVADPIAPPEDRTVTWIFAQELGRRRRTRRYHSSPSLRCADGLAACFGEIPAGEEGPGTATTLDVGTSGEDTAGVLTTIEEAGGWAEWRLHTVVVRQGPCSSSSPSSRSVPAPIRNWTPRTSSASPGPRRPVCRRVRDPGPRRQASPCRGHLRRPDSTREEVTMANKNGEPVAADGSCDCSGPPTAGSTGGPAGGSACGAPVARAGERCG